MSGESPAYGDEGERRSPRGDRIFTWPFVNLMIANGSLRVCNYMLMTLVPLYILDRGASATVVGLTTTVFMLSAVLLRPIAGRLVDRRGRYIVMMVGAGLFAAGAAVYCVTLPIWLFLAIRAVQGVGFSLNGTATVTAATDIIPERRMSEGLGYLGLEATIAQTFAPAVALIVLHSFGFDAAFVVAFAVALVTVLVRFPLGPRMRAADRRRRARVESRARGARATARTPLWQHIVERDAWRPASIMLLVTFGTVSVNVFLAAYLAAQVDAAVAFFIVSGVAIALARLLVGRIERLVGIGWTIGTALVSIAGAFLLVFAGSSLVAVVIAGVLFGWGVGIVQPAVSGLAVTVAARQHRGMANSTVFLAMDLGNAVGAVVLGAVATATGLGSVFLWSAVVIVIALAVFLVLRSTGGLRPRDVGAID